MQKNNLRIALIPAYEPDTLLVDLLRGLQVSGFKAIVVDDGSDKEYLGIFEQASEIAIVLIHLENRGKGRGIKTALEYIKKHFEEPYTIVTMDADGQHEIRDALRVCEEAELRPDTLILGSRGLQEGVPLRSRMGNTITRSVFARSTGLHVHDTQTGLRAFSNKLLPVMWDIPGERYEYEMNVLLKFAHEKRPVRELQISTIYFDNNSGSHFDTIKDSYRIYKEILKFSASSFICFLTDYSLYSLMTVLTGGLGATGLVASNVAARVISSGLNYTLNRKFVFESKNEVWKSAAEYFALAIAILIGDTFVLNSIVAKTGLNPYTAKLITELLFFVISWLMQHLFIFKREGSSRIRGGIS